MNHVLAVMVLYKTNPLESPTFQSLRRAAAHWGHALDLLIYDNSPECSEPVDAEPYLRIQYVHDPSNPGLGKAYNMGLALSSGKAIPWLLLLDQDTRLSEEFLSAFGKESAAKDDPAIACLVPRVLDQEGRAIISPVMLLPGDHYRAFDQLKSGILEKPVSGINSGTFLRVDFIRGIGGFDRRFPLDMLDHWYFSKIAKAGKRVFVLDTTIAHRLSVNTFEQDVSLERYRRILRAEREFYRRSIFSFFVFKARLLKRLSQQLSYSEKGFLFITLKYLLII